MRRRDLLALLGGAAGIWPFAAAAQQPKLPTIGVLVVGSPGSDKFWQLFRQDLRELGYIEGQTVRFEFRSDQGQAGRLPELAAELVRLKVDVIVPWFTPAATAAKQATSEIPIVMATAGDPVATGLVESLARPGGNITGTSGMAADLAGKCVELIGNMLSSAHRVVALVNAPDPFSKPFLEKIRFGGEATGTKIEPVMIHHPEELDAAFLAMEQERPDAGYCAAEPAHQACRGVGAEAPACRPPRRFAPSSKPAGCWVTGSRRPRHIARLRFSSTRS